ncbi:MAG TPA: hypothetical protein VJ602_11730 [Paludibacter sp.]|nr:hypothetical protein [Paludibacter sp.]
MVVTFISLKQELRRCDIIELPLLNVRSIEKQKKIKLVGKKTEKINSSRLRFICNDTTATIICSCIIADDV